MLNTKTEVWQFFNNAKVIAVAIKMPHEDLMTLKQECDDLFSQATDKRFSICPGWWIGGF